ISTRTFRQRRERRGRSRHTIFTAAETEASIARIRPAPGSETPARPGIPHQQRHEQSCNHMPLAAPWANNGSTTSIRLAADFRIPQAALPILAVAAEARLAEAAMPVAAIGDLSSLTRIKSMTTNNSNRWLIAAAGVVMQLALGAVYAWSVFRIPL